jgi:hypothetical protein
MSRIATRIISPWFSLLIFIFTTVLLATNVVFSAEQPDLKVFIGEWIRPDGGYVIRISDIKPDGSVDAGYFNPNVINVTEASISEWKGLLKLFIKLEDEGYPGSTYTLYYYAEKDALAGFYYQAAIKQTFEVVFMRK